MANQLSPNVVKVLKKMYNAEKLNCFLKYREDTFCAYLIESGFMFLCKLPTEEICNACQELSKKYRIKDE